MDDSSNDSEFSKPKRKRENLDHMSIEEKIKRRKLHNRAAAQLARDRKKMKMNSLQTSLETITKEKQILEKSNEDLLRRYRALERENLELKERLSSMSGQSVSGVEANDGIVESAELINVSQPQKHETIITETPLKPVSHSTTPFIYWLAILNLIQCSIISTNALKNYSKRDSTAPIDCQQSSPVQAQSSSPDTQTISLLNT